MKCEFCDVEISDDSKFISQENKLFCNLAHAESYYISKIKQLTEAEKAWHDAWFKLRGIIGELACNGCVSIEEQYKRNKSH